MKAFKYILFLLLIAIIGLSIYVAVQPNSFEVTRERTIDAPAVVIYNNLIDYKNWEGWSPWLEKNPDTKITYSDTTRGVGGHYSWEDSDGIGSMKTISTTPNSSIEQELQFEDYEPSDINWTLTPTLEGKTKVTWQMKGDNIPFMFKAYSAFSGGFDQMMGPDFERGLEKLDSLIIADTKKYSITSNGITEYGGGFYLFKTSNATYQNMSEIMALQFGEISGFMTKNNIPFNGMPFTIYHDMNFVNNSVIMSNAIPVNEKIIVTGEENILCDYIPKLKALKVTLKGNYSNLKEAWQKGLFYIFDENLEQSDQDAFEIYTKDPGNFPNPADWITEIYIPIKD